MNKIRHQFDQLVQGEYREAFILILGMIVMLIGEFSTALAVTKLWKHLEIMKLSYN
ncbi:hypothetical protein [Pediococcus pentosaceus]|uniref:hypothetical protein n=1 Tax=Pediococcus pentosaceus TaxID=1255 RepID=UPI001E43B98D|nr:hypothetical protein [Pediococcus pentosaceus]